MRRVVCKED